MISLAVGLLLLAAASVAWRRGRFRDQRLAQAAHELRGAAAAMSLALDTMRRQPGGRRLALVLDSEFARLRCGLEDLDAARERRRPRLTTRTEPLERVVRSATLGWRSAVEGTGRRVDLRWEAGAVPVVADRGRLAQALGNLVGNASAKKTPKLSSNASLDRLSDRICCSNGRAESRPEPRGDPSTTGPSCKDTTPLQGAQQGGRPLRPLVVRLTGGVCRSGASRAIWTM